MPAELAKQKCKPCSGETPPLKGGELKQLYEQLDSGWDCVEEHHLEKEYGFDDYPQAVQFTNKVADIAQEEGHHPDLLLSYGKVKVTVWTHKIGGLSEADFVFAAKTEEAHNAM